MKQSDRADLDVIISRGAGKMSQRDMADMADVSVSTVNRRIKELNAGAEPFRRPTYGDTDCSADHLSRLEELRDMLYEAMQETGGGSLANLSKEYRATLAEIEAVKAVGDGDEEDDFLSELMRSVSDG